MELALGVLEWPPDQFWNATHRELMAALDGWQEKNGSKSSQPAGMTGDRLKELMRRYPDGRRT